MNITVGNDFESHCDIKNLSAWVIFSEAMVLWALLTV